MEPVDIDIIMRQNISEEGEKASRSLEEMSEQSEALKKAVADALALQQAAIQKLRADLEPLKKQLADLASNAPGPDKAKFDALSKGVDDLESRLIKASQSLSKMDMDAEGLNIRIQNLEVRIKSLAEEIINLNRAGEAESETLKEKTTALEYYMNARNELLESLKNLNGDGDLTEIIEQLQELNAGAKEAGEGIDEFSESGEIFSGVLKNLASMLAMVASQLGVSGRLINQSTQLVGKLVQQKGLLVTVTNALSKSLGISVAAAKGLALVMGGALTLGIGAAIYFIGKMVNKWQEAREQEKKHAESVAQNGASQLALYEKLRRSYNQLGNDVRAKEKYIKDNQDAFKQLGVAINGVNDADTAFINNTEAFRQSIMKRAEAAAAMELATEQYKEYLIARQKQKKKVDEENRRTEQKTDYNKGIIERRVSGQMPTEIRPQVQVNPKFEKIPYSTKKQEVDKYYTEEAAEYKQAGDEWINASVEAEKTAEEIRKKLGLDKWEKPGKTKKDPKDNTAEKAENARKRALEKLHKISLDNQEETDAAIVAAMQDGAAKKLAELEKDFGQRKTLIAERLREIEQLESETGVDGSAQKNQLNQLLDAEQAKYDAAVRAAENASKAVMSEMWDDTNSRFRTESENRLADINRFYNEQLKKAREHGASLAELDKIELARKKDIAIEKNLISLKEFDFRQEIEIRRAEMETRGFKLQAEREEKLLNIQLLSMQKRLQRLILLKEQGADVDKDIEAARLEIERLGIALEKIPGKKLEEIAGYVKKIAGSLSGIGGEFGEAMSALTDGVDDLMTAFDKDSTTMDKVSAGVNGLVKLYNVVANQIEENKKKQEEWNEKIADGEQRARMMRIAESDYKQSNIFGVENPYAKAIAGAKQYADSMRELHGMIGKLSDGQMQTGTKKVVSGKNIVSGAAAGAGAGAAIGSFFPGLGTIIGAGIGALVGGIIGGTQKKVVPVFNSLSKEFGSILKEGTKTFELNPKILENYAKLDDATKKLVDNWEEIRTKALEAEKQMEETFKELAGDIGQQLSKSLADAFRNGDVFSAVDDFQDKVTGTIEKIIEQMIFAAIFQDQLEELQKRMKDSFGDGGDQSIVDDIIWFSKVYKEGIETYGKSMNEAKEEMKKQGFNAWETESSRKAVGKGIAQASQDSIDELSGRITFLVMKVTEIGTISVTVAELNREQLRVQHAMLGHLEVIAENSEFLKKLENISEGIERMVREGVYMKK